MDLLTPSDELMHAAQSVAYTGAAGSLTGWGVFTKGVLVWTTTDAFVAVGENVTASTASTPIPAFTPIPFRVPQGTGAIWRVSAIQVSANGTLFAKPLGE